MTEHTPKPEDKIDEVIKKLIKERNAEDDKFLQSVVINKYPVIVLFNQQQIDDIKRFATAEEFVVLCIDTTFDVGDFFLTTTTYTEVT